MTQIAAIILAAGQATRFRAHAGDTKLIADFHGKPLIRHVAEAALASGIHPLYVVTGHAAESVQEALAGLDVLTVHNSAFAAGLSTSLKAGIAAQSPEVRGVVVLLADMPFITAELINRLVDCFKAAPIEPDAVVPIKGGQWGNPVLLGRKLFADIAGLEGDRGAGALLKQPGRHILECPIDDAGIEIDIDTRETLERLKGIPLS